MKLHKRFFNIIIICFISFGLQAQVAGVFQTKNYLPHIKQKKVGLVINHSSKINNTHLIDTLLFLGVNIQCVFAPEHGFSGDFDAGEYFDDTYYNDTIPIYSLYSIKELQDEHLENIDIIIFDIQDVGVRFYTYISTLHYVMEGCARNNISLIVLDRPNPHINYIDGPVLDTTYKSFVGMHPVPIVYGMTIGEYALMINGEKWLDNNLRCDLRIIKNANYNRYSSFTISDFPSPNLRTFNSIILYPSLCLFEGTKISVGRGTQYPFEVFGAPFFNTSFVFTPKPDFGSKKPKYDTQDCYGYDLRNLYDSNNYLFSNQINIKYLITAYNQTPIKTDFFNTYFNKLAGNNILKDQIISGMSEVDIRKSWESDLNRFNMIRQKYLIYD